MRVPPEEPVKRVRLSPAERRTQLITLGTKMLADRPIEDISINAVATAAGISRGLLFHYFPTKHDFQLEVVRHANAELLAHVAPDPDLGLFEMLADSVHRYVSYVSENRTSYLALLRGPASASPELVALVEQTRTTIVDLILAQVLPEPADRDQPRLNMAVRGWIAFAEETTLSWLRQETITRDELIDLLIESLTALSVAAYPGLATVFKTTVAAS